MINLLYFLIFGFLYLGVDVSHIEAKDSAKKSGTKKSKFEKQPDLELNKNLHLILDRFHQGLLQDKIIWEALTPFESKIDELTLENQETVFKVRSQLLFSSGYQALSAEFATKALSMSKNPFAEKFIPVWKNLWTISTSKKIHTILEDLALRIAKKEGQVPEFGTNWYYILGNAYASKGNIKESQRSYEQVVMQDHYYMPAQYQLALIALEKNKTQEAETFLKSLLSPAVQDLSDLKENEISTLINYAKIALARMAYQQGNFLEAVRMYRMIPRNSHQFYDALFEQSWALFMAGSIKHALGTLYGANSPYFSSKFNPEAKVLESIMYYWMCRYDDARRSLADFSEKHRDAVDSLAGFLDRQRLSPETAYQMFENLTAGVSGESIGIPLNVLKTAAETDSMLLARDQYANLIEEKNHLDTFGIFGITSDLEPYKILINSRLGGLRTELGTIYLNELRQLKDHFEEIYSQSQFLYLELLMSQKEQILGRELHSDSKVTKVTDKDAFVGWSRKTQSWQDNKFEYWWDEIGYHVIDVKPECKI